MWHDQKTMHKINCNNHLGLALIESYSRALVEQSSRILEMIDELYGFILKKKKSKRVAFTSQASVHREH